MTPRRMARARADDETADMTRERRRSDGESAAAPHPSHPLATPPRSDTTTRRSRTLFAERPRGLDRDAARRSRCRRRHRDRDRPEENSHINRGESRVGRRAEAEVARWLRVRWGGGWEVRVKMDRSGGVKFLVVRGPRGEKEPFAAFEESSRGWNGTAPKFCEIALGSYQHLSSTKLSEPSVCCWKRFM